MSNKDEKLTVYQVKDRSFVVPDYSRRNWEEYKKKSYWRDAYRWCESPLGHVGSPCAFCGQGVPDATE